MYILAIDVGGTNIKWAVISDYYKILQKGKYATPQNNLNAFFDSIILLLGKINYSVDGIALSIPGIVRNGEEGFIDMSGNLPYLNNVPLAKMLSEKTNLFCSAENDGRCCALGEYAAGSLSRTHLSVSLTLGTGIGGGIILDGRLLRGTHAFAGEFSYCFLHATHAPEYPWIAGKRSGYNGLIRCVQELTSATLPPRFSSYDIFQKATAGDEIMLSAIRNYCRELALLIWNIQASLDPDRISIGGGISEQPLLFKILNEELEALYNSFHDILPRANIVCAAHGNDSNLLGAVYDCLQKRKI